MKEILQEKRRRILHYVKTNSDIFGPESNYPSDIDKISEQGWQRIYDILKSECEQDVILQATEKESAEVEEELKEEQLKVEVFQTRLEFANAMKQLCYKISSLLSTLYPYPATTPTHDVEQLLAQINLIIQFNNRLNE